jgi:hypothetical protein
LTECQGVRRNPSRQRPIQRARVAKIAVDCDANQILIGLAGAHKAHANCESRSLSVRPLTASDQSPGEQVFADQAAGRLLLLRLGTAGAARRPRTVLRGNGPPHDPGHTRSQAQNTRECIHQIFNLRIWLRQAKTHSWYLHEGANARAQLLPGSCILYVYTHISRESAIF